MFRDRGFVHNYMKLANYFAASNPTVCFTFIPLYPESVSEEQLIESP